MLQRVEAEVGELRGFGVAENAGDAAMIVKVVVVRIVDERTAARIRGRRHLTAIGHR